MPEPPDITVIIPTYRREEILTNTIRQLLKQSYKNFELLVIDQSETHQPATQKALASITDKRLRYVRATPPSLPAARNLGLSLAKAPLVLFVDDDIVPDKDLVKYHLLAFAANPSVNAVAGRVMQAGFPVKKAVLQFDEYGVSHGVFTATQAGFTNAFPGGNHSLRVSDALRLGGFDTRYYFNAFREESDMALRMVRAGMTIYYEPRAELLHLAAHSGGTRVKTYPDLYDTRMFYANELFFTLRAVRPSKLLEALNQKYHAYCLSVRHYRAYRRRLFFYFGLVAAVWRMGFGKKTTARVIGA